MSDEGKKRQLMSLLVRIPFFHHLVPAECRRVLAICEPATFSDGEVIFEVGDLGTRLLILLQGSVSIQLANGKEIAQLEPIDTIGEMEISSKQPRQVNAVALTAVSGFVIQRRDLERLCNEYPDLAVKLLRNVVNALAQKLSLAITKLE